jgi:hypothetical protein
MGLDIRLIRFDQLWSIPDDQQILGIARFGLLRKVE